MKKLEEIIRKNSKSFDSEEPSSNHFEKFLDKLDSRQIHSRRDRMIRILTHAASIAAAVLLIVSIVLLKKLSFSDKNISFKKSSEAGEIEMYYQGQIDLNFQVFNSTLKGCPVQRKNLRSCFKELDKSFESIQHDLKENPGDERVLNALINNYQMKLEIMDQVMKQSNKNCI